MLRSTQLIGFNVKPAGGVSGVTKVMFLTGGTSAARPADWNDANNTVECIGAGSSGGGAYSLKNNVTLSGTFNYGVGAGSSGDGTAGDTWCQGANFAGSACGAKGAAGHLGGVASAGFGDVRFSGGNSTNTPNTGGGGAAGPHGNGANGAASPTLVGGGGGSGNNGSGGTTAGVGGNNRHGTGGGTAGAVPLNATGSVGGTGTNSGGGGGGGCSTDVKGDETVGFAGGPGGTGEQLWLRTEGGAAFAGPGGGGGGGGSESFNANGGAGGLYGGGGGRRRAARCPGYSRRRCSGHRHPDMDDIGGMHGARY